jgi:pyruvate kinase
MKLIATLPPPHQPEKLKAVAEHPLIAEARFNVGMRTPYSPKETLERLLAVMDGKPLWVDLKGRQLRIMQWAVPAYGDIILNHAVKVDLPARIEFRDGQFSEIVEVRGNRIFVDPDPPAALGRGQSVNIHGSNLEIDGYLTKEDKAYIKAARELGIHKYMLSFVEETQDIEDVFALDSKAEMIAKIESLKGLEFSRTQSFHEYLGLDIVRPMAARDDLYANIGDDKYRIFAALQSIIDSTSEAIVASRLCESLRKSAEPSLSDLADLMLLRQMGYREFMLSDELCKDTGAFMRAMDVLAALENLTQDMVRRTRLD